MSAAAQLDFSKAVPIQQNQPAQTGDSSGDLDFSQAQPLEDGQQINDVGNVVIVPKEGESYLDTIHRAIQYHQQLTPQQRQEAINRETAPKSLIPKVGETLAAAPVIGALGASSPAVVMDGIHAAVGALTPALTKGVVAVGEWASEHPTAAKFIWESLKTALAGTAVGAGSKFVGKLIDTAPTR